MYLSAFAPCGTTYGLDYQASKSKFEPKTWRVSYKEVIMVSCSDVTLYLVL